MDKVIVVLPAYNAARTLERTVSEIPAGVASEIILVDDGSHDDTVARARELGLTTIVHERNKGYGGNQKTCYNEALARDADIVVMLHPDYQYDPRVMDLMVKLIRLGICDVVLGSRIRARQEALASGMPAYKYVSNRVLSLIENVALGQNLSEWHTGYRAFTRRVLETVPFMNNSDDFVFDSEFLVQCVYYGFRIGDIPVPVRYEPESSSINFQRSCKYGFQTLLAVVWFWLKRLGLPIRLFAPPK